MNENYGIKVLIANILMIRDVFDHENMSSSGRGCCWKRGLKDKQIITYSKSLRSGVHTPHRFLFKPSFLLLKKTREEEGVRRRCKDM